MNRDYIESSMKQFQYYKYLCDQSILQIKEEDLFWSSDERSNSIAIIMQHMYGNMMSRWTDFLHTDGEKDFRNRDLEFELSLDNKDALLEKWEEGWNCLFTALDSITAEYYDHIVYIRKQGHTIVEAINRQLCHYSYHAGQIVYIARQRASSWSSLSIPKGDSNNFNKKVTAEGQRKEHFTEGLYNNTDS
jgi:hypothetical protein